MAFLKSPKLHALLLTIAALAINLWFFSLRCNSSPAVDWSRFLFATAIEILAIAAPMIAANIFSNEPKVRHFAAFLAAMMVLATMPMVRTSVLLADTIEDKFFPSASYQCPGVFR
jgi:hypothetical protein